MTQFLTHWMRFASSEDDCSRYCLHGLYASCGAFLICAMQTLYASFPGVGLSCPRTGRETNTAHRIDVVNNPALIDSQPIINRFLFESRMPRIVQLDGGSAVIVAWLHQKGPSDWKGPGNRIIGKGKYWEQPDFRFPELIRR